MRMTARNKYRRHSLVVTVILIVLMVSVSLLALRWISQFEEGECFDRLYEETG